MRILAGAILVLAAAIIMAGSLVATGLGGRNYPTEVTWGYFSAFVVGAFGLFLVVREMRSDSDRRL